MFFSPNAAVGENAIAYSTGISSWWHIDTEKLQILVLDGNSVKRLDDTSILNEAK